jgi:hypothetical protein
MLPPFADLRWVTSLSECGINLDDLGEGRVATCDPWNRGGLGYPPLSVEVARFLHVGERQTELLGFAIGAAALCILLGLLYGLQRPGWRRDMCGGLVTLSFPVQLVLERSNIDIIVFLLLTSLAAALACSKRWVIPIAGAISWLTVVIKMYPVAGITAWLGLSIFQRPRFNLARVGSLLGSSLGFATVLPWFLKYRAVAAQPPAGPISHGFIVPISTNFLTTRAPLLGEFIRAIPQPLLGTVIFILVFLWCARICLSSQWEYKLDKQAKGYQRRFLSIMPTLLGCTWLGCYFLSGSFDYRLILALPALLCILSLLDTSNEPLPASTKSLLWLVAISGFTIFMLPAIRYSGLLPTILTLPMNALLLSSDLFLMPVIAGAIAALALPLNISKKLGQSQITSPKQITTP